MMPSHLTARLVQLSWGLALYGLSIGLMVRSNLGLSPWDVFQQGLAERSGLSLGTIIVIIGAAVLLLWIPLRQRPGIGTIANVFLIGIWTDVSLWLDPTRPVAAAGLGDAAGRHLPQRRRGWRLHRRRTRPGPARRADDRPRQAHRHVGPP